MGEVVKDKLSGLVYGWGDKLWEGIDQDLLKRYFEAEEVRSMQQRGVWFRVIPHERLDKIDAGQSLQAVKMIELLVRGILAQAPTGLIDDVAMDKFLGCGIEMAKKIVRDAFERGVIVGNRYEGYRLRTKDDKYQKFSRP